MLRSLVEKLLALSAPSEGVVVTEKRLRAPEGPSEADGILYEMEVGTNELAGLFARKGWQIEGSSSSNGVPNATEVMSVIHDRATQVKDGAVDFYSAGGRFMAINDSDFPGVTDLYLYVGQVSNDLSGADFTEDDDFIE